jgi:hypothetical protein
VFIQKLLSYKEHQTKSICWKEAGEMPALPRNGDSPVDPTNINPFITAGIFS